jgi:AcrR family transcriptional regulator
MSGIPRTTIYFYVRHGLLPSPGKTASGRSVYGEDHLALLVRITDLKERGYSLSEIKFELKTDLAHAEQSNVNLADQETERVRDAILRSATEEFARKGYRGTHIASIVEKLGITPYIFYSHFDSKLDLLVACFNTFIDWNSRDVHPRVTAVSDPAQRELVRAMAGLRVGQLAAELSAVLRLERRGEAADPYRLSETWQTVIDRTVDHFEALRSPGSPPSPLPMELLAYSMIGAFDRAMERVSWDARFTVADALRTHLYLHLALFAALRGDVDIESMLPAYDTFIQELVSQGMHLPPPLEA